MSTSFPFQEDCVSEKPDEPRACRRPVDVVAASRPYATDRTIRSLPVSWQEFYEARYVSKASGSLRRSTALRRAEHLRIERVIRTLIPVQTSTTVLDIGAGRASYLNDADVTALDISDEALSGSPRNRRVLGQADALPFDDASFDIVVCSQVLEHVPNWRSAVSEMARVARSGGLVFVAVPNRYALMKRRYHALERSIDRAGHIHEFREAELYFALMERGLDGLNAQGACYDVWWLLASLERSRRAERWIPVIDKVPEKALAKVLYFDGQWRRRKLSGLSLEVWGFKR